MYRAILLRPDQLDLLDHIQEKVVTYLPKGEYTLCTLSEDNLPESIKGELVEIVYDTGVRSPIRAYQRYQFNLEDLSTGGDGSVPSLHGEIISWPEVSRHLMAVRSRLTFALLSQFSPDRIYFTLTNQPNATGTQREFLYKLRFEQIPCYGLGPRLLESFSETVRQMVVGPLIVSTYTLDMLAPITGGPAVDRTERYPRFYIRELFRDIIESNEIEHSDKIVLGDGELNDIFGTTRTPSGSEELYFFYSQPVNITDDILQELVDTIRGAIVSAIQLKVFPRATTRHYILAKGLQLQANGQYTIPYEVPKTVDWYANRHRVGLSLKGAPELFWFLAELKKSGTYDFIIRELEISVQPNLIQVVYSTEYLPDFIRVLNASNSTPQTHDAVFYYPNGSSAKTVTGSEFRFYDHANQDDVVVISASANLPEIRREPPRNWSLEERSENKSR